MGCPSPPPITTHVRHELKHRDQPQSTSGATNAHKLTLPRGPPAAAVFAIPRITIAGHRAMYGTRPLQLRHMRRNGFDDTPLKVTQCFTRCHQFRFFANSKRVPDGVPQQHRTYRHWPAWKPIWLPQLQGQLVACVHGRGHVPIHVQNRRQMVP